MPAMPRRRRAPAPHGHPFAAYHLTVHDRESAHTFGLLVRDLNAPGFPLGRLVADQPVTGMAQLAVQVMLEDAFAPDADGDADAERLAFRFWHLRLCEPEGGGAPPDALMITAKELRAWRALELLAESPPPPPRAQEDPP
jgi:hypothetical protein